jgi:hypothetical protein
MTGPSLAPLIIPIAGTLCLVAWLAVVFYCGHRAYRVDGHPASGHESPGPGHVVQIPAPAGPQTELVGTSVEMADLREILKVQR